MTLKPTKLNLAEEAIKMWLPDTDQVFTHVDDQTSVVTNYLTSAIYRELFRLGHKANRFHLEPAYIHKLYDLRQASEERILALTPIQLSLPLLFADQDDGTQLLVDGTHRYIRYVKAGLKEAYAFLASRDLWSRFLLPEFNAEEAKRMVLTPGRHTVLVTDFIDTSTGQTVAKHVSGLESKKEKPNND